MYQAMKETPEGVIGDTKVFLKILSICYLPDIWFLTLQYLAKVIKRLFGCIDFKEVGPKSLILESPLPLTTIIVRKQEIKWDAFWSLTNIKRA